MVRCVYCRFLNRDSRYCEAYETTLKLKEIHMQMSCPRYKPKRAEVKMDI